MRPRSTSSLPVAEEPSDPLSTVASHNGQALETECLLPLASSTSVSYTDSDSSESVSIGPSGQDPLVAQTVQQQRQDSNFIFPPASALSELGLDITKQERRDGSGVQQLAQHLQQPKHKRSLRSRLKAMVMHEPLLSATILGVLLGILLGSLIRLARPSRQAIDLIGFPGEIMLRLLKMLVLPLVAGSMIAGVCSLRGSTSSMAKVARWTLMYYAATTLIAVVLGIVLVNVLNPGRGSPLNGDGVSDCAVDQAAAPSAADIPAAVQRTPLEALLDVARNMFPDNVAAAAVNMNILGVITFSLFFGLCLSTVGDAAEPMIKLVDVFNVVISKMVTAVLWTSPLGIASLIAASICRACNLASTLAALGLWVVTVLLGLLLQGGLLLPAALWACTRQSPWATIKGFSQAIVLGFGTSSSSAALPVSMQCAEQLGCDDSIIKFVLPLGSTVNMNGTALYEATTVIFIAQAHNVQLGLAEMTVVACTATLAAVGAAAIPSAGLVTMLMVMQAVSLDQFASDLAVILAIDWLLDRCRTAVNVLGDAFGVVVIDSLCKQDDSRTQHSQASSIPLARNVSGVTQLEMC
ncbi:MAG: dicarboxylate amino acid cation sodium transporter [Trebouxia sp. A1-2]|nr:MAG: dicarboxylate amino acid cation sodium transporter [Trebouxia sp. A1-2]